MCTQPASSQSVSLRQQTQQELWWSPCCPVIPTDKSCGYAQAHWKINTALQCPLTPSGADRALHIFFHWHLSVWVARAGFPQKSLHLVQTLCFVRANKSEQHLVKSHESSSVGRTLLAVLTAAALNTAAAMNTNENSAGAAKVCSRSDTGRLGGLPMPWGGVTQVSVFHDPLPSLQVRTPVQLEEPRKHRKGGRQVPKHGCLLPFYTLDFLCLSSSNVPAYHTWL